MRKLFVILVAIFLMATSAYAMVETENGPVNITTCYIKGTATITSGSVVVLQTTSPTYWGREVTGTTTAGLPIYGVIVEQQDIDTQNVALKTSGVWVRVQNYGYTPVVKVDGSRGASVSAGEGLYTSTSVFKAEVSNSNTVTGNVASMEANAGMAAGSTIKAVIR